MLRQWQFTLPTRVDFGRGALKNLGKTAGQLGRSVLLVGYREPAGLEAAYDRAVRLLAEAGLAVHEFFDVPPDPEAELGRAGADRARGMAADVIVALGGGSVIDAAKGIAVLAKMGGSLWDYTGANPDCRPAAESLPVVAVPTTAGTGSEVTGVAVFTHQGVGSQPGVAVKASISGPAVPPAVAMVDPDLAVGSPPGLTAACGADALGHAVEACMSRRANPVASLLAGRAVGLIYRNLRRAVENPDDPPPREPLALASTLAGAAFSSAGVTVTHAIAQALGGVLHVPHGEGVALGTPHNLRLGAAACGDVYAELARECGIQGDTPAERAARFVDGVLDLLQSVGLPRQIEAPADAPEDLIDRLVRNAFESTPVPIKLNPCKIGEAELREVFERIVVR